MSWRAEPLGAGRHLFAVPDPIADDAAASRAAPSALAQLADLAARGANGELVCSTAGGEIHVFLQRGRIAWASSTSQRRAFTEHLKRITGVDDELLDAVVVECSRTRRPIGEGLIAWKVATAEQVRASLHHQIRMALASAAREPRAGTLFLERAHYCRYDSALTFALDDVLPGTADAGVADAGDAPAPALDPAVALAAVDGLAAAAVLTAQGEPLAVIGDAARAGEVAGLAQRLLQEGQRLAIDLGAGLCHELHIEGEGAHLLLYSTRRAQLAPDAAGPGAWVRIVLVLRHLRQVALARERVGAVAAGLVAAGARWPHVSGGTTA
jgi:hypothetical protein